MTRQHIESGNAITAAVQRMPVTEAASRFGVFTLGEDNQIHLEEKPSHPKPIHGTSECWANLGFYVFSVDALREALNKCREHDFGQDIIPWMINHQMKAGVREKTMYWRDLGTVADYWQAHMDLVATNSPIDLCDPNNPIIGKPHSDAPAKFSNGAQISHGSVFGPGSSVSGRIVSSVISRAKVGSDSVIEQSVILGREDKKSSTGRITRKNIVIGKGVRLKRVIVLESAIVGDGVTLGENPEEETKRWPDLVIKEGPDDTPIIVVPAGTQVEL
jgi:glucose-1-phosphate adenylyltransferase